MEQLESRNLPSSVVGLGDSSYIEVVCVTPPAAIMTDGMVAHFSNLPAAGFTALIDGYSVSASPDNPSTILVVSLDDGHGWTTSDGGETWQELAVKPDAAPTDEAFAALADQLVSSFANLDAAFAGEVQLPDDPADDGAVADQLFLGVSAATADLVSLYEVAAAEEPGEFDVFGPEFD